jgi:alpha-beta hydrolase superfamily lysophospholipase
MNHNLLDRPEVLATVFHPRPDPEPAPVDPRIRDHGIQVDKGVQVAARFHLASTAGANLLFFHGNGEIVSDYDPLAPLYNRLGINFLAVDYRGYGRSSGRPTVSSMLKDCHTILDYVRTWMGHNGCAGPLVVMGRSLGSASAIELAFSRGDDIDALVVESGFAYALPLLRRLGVDVEILGLSEENGFANLDKIRKYTGTTLIIHAEYDHIIPFSDAIALYEASASPEKKLLKIKEANHNDIFLRGMNPYMEAIQALIDRIPGANKRSS